MEVYLVDARRTIVQLEELLKSTTEVVHGLKKDVERLTAENEAKDKVIEELKLK